jgi:hypothetical protein
MWCVAGGVIERMADTIRRLLAARLAVGHGVAVKEIRTASAGVQAGILAAVGSPI